MSSIPIFHSLFSTAYLFVHIRVGWNRGLGYSRGPKDPRFREFRRLFHRFIGPQRSQDDTLLPTQEKYAAKLLLRLLNEPEAFLTHIRQYAIFSVLLCSLVAERYAAQVYGRVAAARCLWLRRRSGPEGRRPCADRGSGHAGVRSRFRARRVPRGHPALAQIHPGMGTRRELPKGRKKDVGREGETL